MQLQSIRIQLNICNLIMLKLSLQPLEQMLQTFNKLIGKRGTCLTCLSLIFPVECFDASPRSVTVTSLIIMHTI